MKKQIGLLIPMIIGMMLITAFGIPQDKTVVIEAGSEQFTLKTRVETVRELLDETDLILAEYDYVTPGPEDMIENGMTITIRSATPVWLQADGAEERLMTTENTVQGLLQSAGIQLGEYDQVEPAMMTLLKPETRVVVTRVQKEYYYETVEIPPQQITRFTDALPVDETRLVQEGEAGLTLARRARITKDGQPAGEELVSTEVLRPAMDHVEEQGRERLLITGDGDLIRYKEVYTMTATAYDAGYYSTGKNPGDPGYGITRSGTRVRPGVVAVDPRVIPLGSTLYVESLGRSSSYGVSYAEDTGGAIRGNRIDLYYESRSEALRFGRQSVRVYVLEDE
ncbi:3D domain-containing protein [Anoxynatronum buryatiense]|uniref:G5 domain-containing protein n=1 Tax=Anoxynatronum buryatiense TaxID=489973 RepID=A0AA46AJ37_9CLOT|nr:3D domain-containing protein [Anoxynatronum buryatiense]SMP56142.1 protein of unknown function [Anoxynatronum buryatiense]